MVIERIDKPIGATSVVLLAIGVVLATIGQEYEALGFFISGGGFLVLAVPAFMIEESIIRINGYTPAKLREGVSNQKINSKVKELSLGKNYNLDNILVHIPGTIAHQLSLLEEEYRERKANEIQPDNLMVIERKNNNKFIYLLIKKELLEKQNPTIKPEEKGKVLEFVRKPHNSYIKEEKVA